MSRYIDSDALLEDIRKNSESYFADDFAHEWVDKQPTADVRENVHGEWESTDLIGFKRCSVCRALWHVDITGNLFCYYCPKCGADMRGDEK